MSKRVIIIDPLIRGTNDHHYSHINAVSDGYLSCGCEVEIWTGPSPDVGFVGLTHKRNLTDYRGGYLSGPLLQSLSSLNKQMMQIRPAILNALDSVESVQEICFPNCTLAQILIVSSLLKDVERVTKRVRIYTCQLVFPECLDLSNEIWKNFVASVNVSSLQFSLASPNPDYPRSVFEGKQLPQRLDLQFVFPPIDMGNEKMPISLKGKRSRLLTYIGRPVASKVDLEFLTSLVCLERLTADVFVPEGKYSDPKELKFLKTLHGTDRNKIRFITYGSLSSGEFRAILRSSKIVYMASPSDFYSAQLGYSQRALECLASGIPVLCNLDVVAMIPYLDLKLDGVMLIEPSMRASSVLGQIEQELQMLTERAESRASHWVALLSENSLRRTWFPTRQGAICD